MGIDGGRGGSVRVSVSGGPGSLMRPVADGKKLFLWREVLVLTDLNLLGVFQRIYVRAGRAPT